MRIPPAGVSRAGPTQRRPVVDGKVFNSRGVHVAIILGPAIFDLKGKKLYDLKGVSIYKLSGEMVGHLTDAQSPKRHLDKSTDRLSREVKTFCSQTRLEPARRRRI